MGEDRVSWTVIARRIVPWIIVQLLLRICVLMIFIGYGHEEMTDFRKKNL